MRKSAYKDTLILVLFSVSFILLLNRALRSVELTDEIHGIASIYNIYLGKAPFMTSWDYHTGWCLLVPFFALFHRISPDFEGIVLFFRTVYIIFTVFSAIIIAILFRRRNNTRIWFGVLPVIFFVPLAIFQANYNSFTIYLLMIAASLLQTTGQEKSEALRYFMAGVLIGLGCILYPTLVVCAILLTGWIGLINRKYYWKQRIFWYICGGVVVASVFSLWIFSKGSASLFFRSLEGMFTSPHEKSKGVIDAEFIIQTFWRPIKNFLNRKFSFVLTGYALTLLTVKIKFQKAYAEKMSLFAFLLYAIMNIGLNRSPIGYATFGMLIGFILMIVSLNIYLLKKYAGFFLLLTMYVLTYSFSSDNKNIFVAFEIAGPMITLIIGLISWLEFIRINSCFGAAIGAILICCGLVNVYTFVYRDAPIQELTVRVETGIYKGLYTTAERKAFVETVEEELEQNILPYETVCVVTRAPMVYLMSKAKICAPQTWDAQFMERGFTAASPLTDYFQAIAETPDILVATSLDIQDFYNNETYEINSFINKNYEMYYKKQIEGTDIYLWRKK